MKSVIGGGGWHGKGAVEKGQKRKGIILTPMKYSPMRAQQLCYFPFAVVVCPPHSEGASVGDVCGCTCSAGYEGTIEASSTTPFYLGVCTDIDECENVDCGAGGTCINVVGETAVGATVAEYVLLPKR